LCLILIFVSLPYFLIVFERFIQKLTVLLVFLIWQFYHTQIGTYWLQKWKIISPVIVVSKLLQSLSKDLSFSFYEQFTLLVQCSQLYELVWNLIVFDPLCLVHHSRSKDVVTVTDIFDFLFKSLYLCFFLLSLIWFITFTLTFFL
jgi:hypothetical protein